MDWQNERWVKLYTRDTVTWTLLSWQARALLCLVLRKVDRAGRLELGRHGAKGLAAAVAMPVDVVEAGLDDLLGEGVAVLDGPALVLPHFEEAQQAQTSVAERARRHRERKEANSDATPCNAEQRHATQSNAMQRDVTARNDQNRSEQIRREEKKRSESTPPKLPPQDGDPARPSNWPVASPMVPEEHSDQEMPTQGKLDPVDAKPGRFALTAPPLDRPTALRARAEAFSRATISYLNTKTGRTGAQLLDPIASSSIGFAKTLIENKHSIEQAKHVIDAKVAEWHGTDMEKHLKPSTLFRLSNFRRYLAEDVPRSAIPTRQRATGRAEPAPHSAWDDRPDREDL